MPRNDKSRFSAFALLDGRRGSVFSLALSSLTGGAAEAVFLVVITRAAFAVTDGRARIGILAGRSLSVHGTLLLAFGLVVLRLVLAVASTAQAARLSNDVMADVRRQLAEAFLRSSWALQQDQRAGRLQELLTTFAGNASAFLGGVTGVVTAGFNLAALLGLAIAVDPAGSVVVVVAVAILGSVLRPVRAAVRRQAARTAESGMAFATSLSEISDLGMEVHIFNVQPQTEARVTLLINENAAMSERLMFLRNLLPNGYSGLAYLALVGAITFVVSSDATSFSSLGAVMLVMLRSLSYGQGLQVCAAAISSSAPFVDALQKQLAVYTEAKIADHGQPIGEVGTLALRSVSFRYVEGQPVLTDIDASIVPREIVGIVGPSGSGKSTLVQLMLGLRPPSSGEVLAEGRNIHLLSRTEWARKVTFVPQAPHLISGSVADNIRFLRDGVSDEDIETAARLAHLHEDVSGWPEGYHRFVGERGGHLSGGQQQRLCIARALVEHPDVLILDEPTSSLDVVSESMIRHTLSELRRTMTVIVIAHRMSTLAICDRIMVIQNGRLMAFDTPTNLERNSDFYREALALSGLG